MKGTYAHFIATDEVIADRQTQADDLFDWAANGSPLTSEGSDLLRKAFETGTGIPVHQSDGSVNPILQKLLDEVFFIMYWLDKC